MMSIADQIRDALERGASDGLQVAARLVLESAKRKLPVGDPALDPDPSMSLADSGRIERHGDGWRVIFDAPYAAKQHEDQRLKHPRSGGAKYLEHALTEAAPALEQIIAARVHALTATGDTQDPRRSHHRKR